MKHLKKTSLLLLSFSAIVGASVTSIKSSPLDNGVYAFNSNGMERIVQAEGKIYTTEDHYMYRLEKAFTQSPDSFEAWINVPAASMGGTIMGNVMYNFGKNADGTYDQTVRWYVDSIGRVGVKWGIVDGVEQSFPGAYVNDGKWHHIAIIRNPDLDKFTLYIDAVKSGELIARVKDALIPNPMGIGCDTITWTVSKTPFDGKIREVTVYTDAISEQRVIDDYALGKGYKDDFNGKLIGNWYLGEDWNKRLIKETSDGENNAYLASFEKYVPIAETPEFDYTIVGMPDIQTMVDFPKDNWDGKNVWQPMMDYIADNIEREKMIFCVQTGDISDNGDDYIQFGRAKEGFDRWEGKLPYSIVPGNHDYYDNSATTRDLRVYNAVFSEEEAKTFKEFGGTFEAGDMANSYYLFDACGIKYCVINLELFPRMSVIRWAGRLCEQFEDRRVIINTHCSLDYYGRHAGMETGWTHMSYGMRNYTECNYATVLYDEVVTKYKNVFMTLGGHFCADDVILKKEYGVHGNPIIEMLIDVQCSTDNMIAYNWQVDPLDVFLLMKFNEKNKEIYFRYISPKKEAAWNLQNQFTLSFADWKDPITGK